MSQDSALTFLLLPARQMILQTVNVGIVHYDNMILTIGQWQDLLPHQERNDLLNRLNGGKMECENSHAGKLKGQRKTRQAKSQGFQRAQCG